MTEADHGASRRGSPGRIIVRWVSLVYEWAGGYMGTPNPEPSEGSDAEGDEKMDWSTEPGSCDLESIEERQ